MPAPTVSHTQSFMHVFTRSPTRHTSTSIIVSELDACHFFPIHPPHPPPLKLARRTVLWSDKKIKMKQQPKNVGLRHREDPAAARYAPPPDALQMFFFIFFYVRCPCDLVWLWFFWVYPLGEAELLKHGRSTVEKKEGVTALRVSLQTTWIWFEDIFNVFFLKQIESKNFKWVIFIFM